MTEYPTRRSLREAEAARARAQDEAAPPPFRWTLEPEARVEAPPAAVAAPQPAATPTPRHPHHRVRLSRRARARILMSAGASILLAGSAAVALPADAATIPGGHTVYASQLLADPQSFKVAADAAGPSIVTDTYGVERPSAADVNSTAAGSGITFTVGGTTNADWAALVLQDASLPVTRNNLTVILQWMDSENSPQDWWLRNNPLNNGLGSGGGAGFGSYSDLQTAASYVAQQLDRSLFAGIHDALAADSAPSVTAQAIMASAWAGSHYGYGSLWHGVDVPIVAAPASDW